MPASTALFRPQTVALAAVVLFLSSCQREKAAPPATEAPPLPPVVVAPPVLDRAGILSAMDSAASAHAAGTAAIGDSLAGRRFVVRQAMGCGAPQGGESGTILEDGVGHLVQTDKAADLKLTLTPADWSPALSQVDGVENWEAAEGFWLSWPWLRQEACPRLAPAAAEGDEVGDKLLSSRAPQTAGLAAVFETDGSRLGRRQGKAYGFTLRGGGQIPVPDEGGYRLVLEGRMAAFGDGQSIRCHTTDPDQRPVCIAAVRLERVAFETASGQTLSEWRS